MVENSQRHTPISQNVQNIFTTAEYWQYGFFLYLLQVADGKTVYQPVLINYIVCLVIKSCIYTICWKPFCWLQQKCVRVSLPYLGRQSHLRTNKCLQWPQFIAKSTYKRHVSHRTAPWSSGRRSPDLMNHILTKLKSVCIIYLGKRFQQNNLCEENK